MLTISDYLALDATAMVDGIATGQFTAHELMQCAIQQAEKLNPLLNAINCPLYDQALEQSKAAGASPMAGLPFLIKDLSDLKGSETKKGSQLFGGVVANKSAAIVERFTSAGLIPIGKSNTPEFGLTITTEPLASGITRNPWNLEYSTGGSSGGSAAAVAAGILPVAHATDGGGSIRVPASCCGLFGLKPSRGLTVIESGLSDSWSGMSVGHVVSRTVRDSARFLELISLVEPKLFPRPAISTNFTGQLECEDTLRIAVLKKHPFNEPIDDECLTAVNEAAKLCSDLGHEVVELEQLPDYKSAAKAMNSLIALHTFQAVSKRVNELDLALETAPMETSTRQMALYGQSLGINDYTRAMEDLHKVATEIQQFHDEVDLVLSPVLTRTPAQIGWLDMNSEDGVEYVKRYKSYGGFTSLQNGTGQPAMSVPMSQTADGVPVGVMFSAAWGGDQTLLQLAAQIEAAKPWPQIAPLATADDSELTSLG